MYDRYAASQAAMAAAKEAEAQEAQRNMEAAFKKVFPNAKVQHKKFTQEERAEMRKKSEEAFPEMKEFMEGRMTLKDEPCHLEYNSVAP